MTRILLVGQGKWSRHLANALNRSAGESVSCAYWSIDTPWMVLSLRNLTTALKSDVIVRVRFRPGSSSLRGRGLDAFWNLLLAANRSARPFIYWIGSDVSDLLFESERSHCNRRLNSIVARPRNIAGSERLASELAAVGINSKHVPFPGGLNQVPETVTPLPPDFAVLTYVSDGR